MTDTQLLRARPMSPREIAAKAGDYDFDTHISLKYWLRTAETLLREASIYYREQNWQQVYLLLLRYATLTTEHLPTHPEAQKEEYRAELRKTRKMAPSAIKRLEELKPKILERYQQWEESAEAGRRERSNARLSASSTKDHALSDPAVAGSSLPLEAAENGDLAIRLARKEFRRRTARKATRQAGISEEEEADRRTAGLWDDWEAKFSRDATDGEDLQKQMAQARKQIVEAEDAQRVDGASRHSRQRSDYAGAAPQYKYPSINKSQSLPYRTSSDGRPQPLGPLPTPEASYSAPPLPPKVRYETIAPRLYTDPHPPLPEKLPENRLLTPSPPPDKPEPPAYTFKPAAYLENGAPLRTLWLPENLRSAFLEYASSNTRRNLETCGVLCGTIMSNAIFVSRVVIPEQVSTSDTCDTVNEVALLEYCAAEDLMVFGWIHTHPSQTCFMSSRDLHTHQPYQTMIAESIAIVCAPSKSPSYGVFRLTDPPGMQAISACRQSGVFHPHAETNIYTDALKPGHVIEAKGLDFEVVDLRP